MVALFCDSSFDLQTVGPLEDRWFDYLIQWPIELDDWYSDDSCFGVSTIYLMSLPSSLMEKQNKLLMRHSTKCPRTCPEVRLGID